MFSIKHAIILVSITALLSGCDKIGIKPPEVKAETGKWEFVTTARLPESEMVVTASETVCLTAEEVEKALNSYPFLIDEKACELDLSRLKIKKNVTKQTLICSHPIVGSFDVNMTIAQGTNVFDKFATIEAIGIVTAFHDKLRDLGMDQVPKEGDKIEFVELAVRKEDPCSDREIEAAKKSNNKRKSNATPAGGSKLSDFLGD